MYPETKAYSMFKISAVVSSLLVAGFVAAAQPPKDQPEGEYRVSLFISDKMAQHFQTNMQPKETECGALAFRTTDGRLVLLNGTWIVEENQGDGKKE